MHALHVLDHVHQWTGDFSPTSGPVVSDMPDDLDLGYSPAFLAATDFIKETAKLERNI